MSLPVLGIGACVVAPGTGAGVGPLGVGTGAIPVTIGGAGVLGFGATYPGVGLGPGVGASGQEATLQQDGSFGSGTSVQPDGTESYLAHLDNQKLSK